MKTFLPTILIFTTSLFLFTGCLTFETPSLSPASNPDMDEFTKNHTSKNKKIFLEVECHHFINGDPPLFEHDENDDLTKVFKDKLNAVQFAEFVTKKEDADFIIKVYLNQYETRTTILTIVSALTLYIIPSKSDLTEMLKVDVLNVKNKEIKEFQDSIATTMWMELAFLPVRIFYKGRNEETINNLNNFIYTIGNDPIFKEDQSPAQQSKIGDKLLPSNNS